MKSATSFSQIAAIAVITLTIHFFSIVSIAAPVNNTDATNSLSTSEVQTNQKANNSSDTKQSKDKSTKNIDVDKNSTPSAMMTEPPIATDAAPNNKTSKGLIAQTFPLHGSSQLKLQFRYINGTLKYLYFWNTGEAIIVSVFASDYVIGEGDDLAVKAPNVEKIVVEVKPYDPNLTTGSLYLGEESKVKKFYIFSKTDSGLYLINSPY